MLFTWAIDRKLPGKLGRKLINDAFSNLIYKQPYGGCRPWDHDMALKRFNWNKVNHLQQKEDGMTLMIDISNLTVRTRNGQDVTAPMSRYLQPVFDALSGFEKVLHVEAMMLEPDCIRWMPRPKANGIYNQIFKHEGSVNPGRIYLVALDCINSMGFYAGKDNTDQAERYANLQHLSQLYQIKTRWTGITAPKLQAVEQVGVRSLADARTVTQNIIRLGGEGAVLKDPVGAWRDGKMGSQMKIKNEFECTLLVVGYKPHKVHPEWVGSLICASCDGKLSTAVGSGLNEEDGHPLDRRQGFDAFDGKLVEVRAESVSKHNALNLPRIVEIRHDKEWADPYDHILKESKPGC
jgi:ATP-dependent DNA ligase